MANERSVIDRSLALLAIFGNSPIARDINRIFWTLLPWEIAWFAAVMLWAWYGWVAAIAFTFIWGTWKIALRDWVERQEQKAWQRKEAANRAAYVASLDDSVKSTYKVNLKD